MANPAPANTFLGLGIFDTGDDGIAIPPETNSYYNINAVYPAAPIPAAAANTNDAIVGAPTGFTIGGFYGLAAGGPELASAAAAPFNGPAHVFTSNVANSRAQAAVAPITQGGLAASLTYFGTGAGALFSEPNIGLAFVAGVGTPATKANALVAEIDPTIAGALPFASGNTARAALAQPTTPLDQLDSSVSFYNSGSMQVPTLMSNFNPGFLSVLSMTDSSGSNFTRTTVAGPGVGNPGTTRGGNTGGPVVALAAGNVFNLAPGNYNADSGNPGFAAGGTIGAAALNGFGQYWNFQTNQLLLFGPTNQVDKNIVGPGILFTTDRTSVGLAGTGVNELATNGLAPVTNSPTAANPNGNATVVPSLAPEQSSAIFRTQLTHSNAAYVSGIDALNLTTNDQMLALSLGGDTIPNPLAAGLPARLANTNAIFFSVDRNSIGLADDPNAFGGGVMTQAAFGRQSANMYLSLTGSQFPIGGVNGVKYSGDLLGLGPNAGPVSPTAGRGQVDQLRDFVLQSSNGYYNVPINKTIDPTGKLSPSSYNVQRNIDPTITTPGDASNPAAGIAVNDPALPAAGYGARGDVYGANFDTYFTLDRASPSRVAAGVSSADILVNNLAGAGPGFHVFAAAPTLGLNAQDQIDALTFARPLNHPTQTIPLQPGNTFKSIGLIPGTNFDPNVDGLFDGIDPFHGAISDLALFTLDRNSRDLNIFDPVIGRNLSASDVFVSDFDGTFALYDTAESLGLNPTTDEITGLKSLPLSAVPEPTMAALMLLGVSTLLRSRRRPSRDGWRC